MERKGWIIISVCVAVIIILAFITFNLTGNVVKTGGWFNKEEVYTVSEIDELIEKDGQAALESVTKITENEISLARINVQDYGAMGDGVTDDTQAIKNAIWYVFNNGGGEIYLPPTGSAYLLMGNLELFDGVGLKGDGIQNFPGTNAPEEEWTSKGTWIKLGSDNAKISLQGHGNVLEGINFIHQQGSVWNPDIDNDWAIKVTGSFFRIENIVILNSAKCLKVEYTPTSGGGTYSSLKNIYFSCYKNGLSLNKVNDNLNINNLHFRNLIDSSSNEVSNYLLNNYIAMEVGYLDNPQVSGLDFFQAHTAILFKNDAVSFNQPGIESPRHSLYNGQFTNIGFNLVRFAMRVEDSSTVVTGQFNNVVAQGAANNFGLNVEDTLFSLRSDSVDLQFSNLFVPHTGGAVMEIGSGSNPGAFVMVDNVRIKDFSASGNARSAFIVYPGAVLDLGINNIQSSNGFSAINSQGTLREVGIV